MNITLYHLTDMSNINSIMQNGLIPKIGENSQHMNETVKRIYLSDKESIPFWMILLNRNALLEITIDANDVEQFKYTSYTEYLCEKTIPQEQIKISKYKPTYSKQHMKQLCKNSMHGLSRCVTLCADFYTRKDWLGDTSIDDVKHTLSSEILLSERIDYSVMSTSEIEKELKYMGETLCMNTFVDTYFNQNTRLYQQLINYPEDELTSYRTKIYEIIKNSFKNNLETNTGGYCW